MSINWASSELGADLVDCSSEVEDCEASHVLQNSLNHIWLTREGLPQWFCLSLARVQQNHDIVIRTVGWHCWHPYTTNPRVMTVHVSSDGSKFKQWDSFQAVSPKRGTQLFCCAPISASIYPYLAFEITETFGGNNTYLNRLFLYSDEIATSPQQSLTSGKKSSSRSGVPGGDDQASKLTQSVASSFISDSSMKSDLVLHNLEQALNAGINKSDAANQTVASLDSLAEENSEPYHSEEVSIHTGSDPTQSVQSKHDFENKPEIDRNKGPVNNEVVSEQTQHSVNQESINITKQQREHFQKVQEFDIIKQEHMNRQEQLNIVEINQQSFAKQLEQKQGEISKREQYLKEQEQLHYQRHREIQEQEYMRQQDEEMQAEVLRKKLALQEQLEQERLELKTREEKLRKLELDYQQHQRDVVNQQDRDKRQQEEWWRDKRSTRQESSHNSEKEIFVSNTHLDSHDESHSGEENISPNNDISTHEPQSSLITKNDIELGGPQEHPQRMSDEQIDAVYSHKPHQIKDTHSLKQDAEHSSNRNYSHSNDEKKQFYKPLDQDKSQAESHTNSDSINVANTTGASLAREVLHDFHSRHHPDMPYDHDPHMTSSIEPSLGQEKESAALRNRIEELERDLKRVLSDLSRLHSSHSSQSSHATNDLPSELSAYRSHLHQYDSSANGGALSASSERVSSAAEATGSTFDMFDRKVCYSYDNMTRDRELGGHSESKASNHMHHKSVNTTADNGYSYRAADRPYEQHSTAVQTMRHALGDDLKPSSHQSKSMTTSNESDKLGSLISGIESKLSVVMGRLEAKGVFCDHQADEPCTYKHEKSTRLPESHLEKNVSTNKSKDSVWSNTQSDGLAVRGRGPGGVFRPQLGGVSTSVNPQRVGVNDLSYHTGPVELHDKGTTFFDSNRNVKSCQKPMPEVSKSLSLDPSDTSESRYTKKKRDVSCDETKWNCNSRECCCRDKNSYISCRRDHCDEEYDAIIEQLEEKVSQRVYLESQLKLLHKINNRLDKS